LLIVKIPNLQFIETKQLSKTKRGNGGFGSTGKFRL